MGSKILAVQGHSVPAHMDQHLQAVVAAQAHGMAGIHQGLHHPVKGGVHSAIGGNDGRTGAQHAGGKGLIGHLAEGHQLAGHGAVHHQALRGLHLGALGGGILGGGSRLSAALGVTEAQDKGEDKGHHHGDEAGQADVQDGAGPSRLQVLNGGHQTGAGGGKALELHQTGKAAGGEGGDEHGDEGALEAQGDAVHGGLGDTSHQSGEAGGGGSLAHVLVLGAQSHGHGGAALGQVGAQLGHHHQAVKASRTADGCDGNGGEHMVHTEEHQHGVNAADDAHGQPAQIGLNPLQTAGDGLTGNGSGRAHRPQGNGGADEHDEHGVEEGLGDGGGDAVHQLLHLGQHPGHDDGGQNGVGVVGRSHRHPEQGDGVSGGKHGLEGGVHQNTRNGDAQIDVGVEVPGGGSGHQDGQEVEGAVADDVEHLIGGALLSQNPQHGQQHQQHLHHGAADDGGDDGGHGAQQGVHHPGGNGLFLFLLFLLDGLALVLQHPHLLQGLVNLGHPVADDDLILAAGVDHADDAGDLRHRRIVGQGLVGQGQTQPGGAVGRP